MSDIASAYGGALFSLAREEGIDGELLSQLETVCGIVGDNPDFVRLMSAPTIKKAQRLELLEEAFGGRVHGYLVNFMSILTGNNAFSELPGCLGEYARLYNEAHGIAEVTAVTPVELEDGLKEALRQKLCSVMGKEVKLKSRIEPDLIGGVRLEMSGVRLDGSLKGRFEAVRQSLLRAKAQ